MRLPAEQRRSQLFDVACEVFAAAGFHATSMDEIAEAAGVTKPVLYQHFPSKRALYRELLADVASRLVASVRGATGDAESGRARVQEGFAAYFSFVTANRAAFRLLFGASVRNDDEFADIAERAIDQVASLTAGLIDIDAEPEHRLVLAHAVVGMAEATSRRLPRSGGELDPDVLAGWLAEMAWFGLRGVRGDAPTGAPTV
ncbi:MAG TPA: TetR/AcrR family transcriptional regulator [Acidimicrobiia bacterium]|nr:TetR/AcrR family transcriptional regulator [Acidimicrobiia bacterium]